MLLPLAGSLGVFVDALHGVLGEVRIIAPLEADRQAKAFLSAIWWFSAIAWMISSAIVGLSPWLIDDRRRLPFIALAILPLVYGLIVNAWISRGRHFGWKLLGMVVSLALIGAL